MGQDTSPEGIISADELNRLGGLFRQFEGSAEPLSTHCREIESEFNSLIEPLYVEKVRPHFQSVTRT